MADTSLIGEKLQIRCVFLILVLMPFFAIAGGRGIPLLVAIGGAVWMSHSLKTSLQNSSRSYIFSHYFLQQSRWIWGLAAFLFWACLSNLWSTYESPKLLGNSYIVAFGAVLYFAFHRQISFCLVRYPGVMKKTILGITLFLLVILFWDISTSYGLSLFFDPKLETETVEKKELDLIQNTSNGITTLAIWLPAALMILVTQFRRGWWLAIALFFAAIYTAYLGQMDSALIAMVLAIIVMGLAYYWPLIMTKLVILAAMISWIAAPILGYIFTNLPQVQQSALPKSWEHRAKKWAYVSEKIKEHPVLGHGFDMSRSFKDLIENNERLEGLQILSLHPHNAGLHIWLETGLIGLCLVIITLYLLGKHLTEHIRRNRLYAVMLCGFMITVIIIANISYGVWQEWWWASIIYAAAFSKLNLSKSGDGDKIAF